MREITTQQLQKLSEEFREEYKLYKDALKLLNLDLNKSYRYYSKSDLKKIEESVELKPILSKQGDME
jgi:hypothetical protein